MIRRPGYDEYVDMSQERGPLGEAFARQALITSAPWLPKPTSELDVLDVGSGYGHTARALARVCRTVVGLEPALDLHNAALDLAAGVENLRFKLGGVENLAAKNAFDFVVLDNVYEHLPDHAAALTAVTRAPRPGGVLYLLTPNKAWPIEAHYGLPFLSWLPLRAANHYLRWSGRGTDYADASYAPTYWELSSQLRARPELEWCWVLPGDPSATVAGTPMHYRLGMAALRRFPILWAVSKALLVVAVKIGREPPAPDPASA